MKAIRVFEPTKAITNADEFVIEILKFAKHEDLDIEIVEESMEPVIKYNDRYYVCHLDKPNLEETENPFQRAFGIIENEDKNCVYIYRDDTDFDH